MGATIDVRHPKDAPKPLQAGCVFSHLVVIFNWFWFVIIIWTQTHSHADVLI